jgi:Polysaccharide lyase/Concanavalin A-like lectin/glucanases superfamily
MKRLLALAAAIAACLVLPTAASAGVEGERAAFWSLNEANGTSGANDSADSHDGTYSSSGVTYGVAGARGSGDDAAISLDGTNGKVTTSYNPFQNGTARSFEGWAKRTGSSYDMLFSGDGSRPPELYLQENADQIIFWSDTGTGTLVSWSNVGAGTGNWFHWVLVFDEPGNTAELFVNGVSKGKLTLTTQYHSSSGNIELGYQSSTNALAGSLDDVAVYGRGLSPEEVAELAVPVSFRDSFENTAFPQVFSTGAWGTDQGGNLKFFDTGSGERIDQITPSGFSATQGSKVVDAELTAAGERAEIQCHRASAPNDCAGGEGSEYTYDFDFRVPSGYDAPSRPGILMQTKPTDVTPLTEGHYATGCYGGGLKWDVVPGDSTRVELLFESRSGIVINDGTNHCTTDAYTLDSLGVVDKDRWHSLKLHAKWSASASTGFIQVWLDGREAIGLRHQRTLIDGTGRKQMFRLGLYESLNADQYHKDFRAFYDNVVIRKH